MELVGITLSEIRLSEKTNRHMGSPMCKIEETPQRIRGEGGELNVKSSEREKNHEKNYITETK